MRIISRIACSLVSAIFLRSVPDGFNGTRRVWYVSHLAAISASSFVIVERVRASRALAWVFAIAISTMLDRIARITITTSNSTSVNPRGAARRRCGVDDAAVIIMVVMGSKENDRGVVYEGNYLSM